MEHFGLNSFEGVCSSETEPDHMIGSFRCISKKIVTKFTFLGFVLFSKEKSVFELQQCRTVNLSNLSNSPYYDEYSRLWDFNTWTVVSRFCATKPNHLIFALAKHKIDKKSLTRNDCVVF